MLVDSHCHLDFPDFADELDDIVARAEAAGIGRMVISSCSFSDFWPLSWEVSARGILSSRIAMRENTAVINKKGTSMTIRFMNEVILRGSGASCR